MKRVKISFTGLLIAASAVYILSALLTNILGDCWFTKDMYSDAYLAGLMAREGTLFPDSWVFGNQYYVIATPAVAALFCTVIKDCSLAIRFASCVMTAAELLLFLWCVRPYCEKKSAAAGLCCISGAVLIGQSFCTDLKTFQLYYTMASFYACYVIGILLCMGIFLRLNREQKVPLPVRILSYAVCFALGMQSLRQTLVLVIPLALVEAWSLLCGNKNKNRTVFTVLTVLSNIGGLIFIKLLKIKAYSVANDIGLTKDIGELMNNLRDSLKSFINIIGLNYVTQGIKWIPLGLAAIFIVIVALSVLFLIIRKRDTSPIAILCIFGWISILGVVAVGTLLMRVRNIYFFVWYLLAAFSFIYLCEHLADNKKFSAAVLALLLAVSVGNWFYNFYPDAARYKEISSLAHSVADELAAEGVDTIFFDFPTMPIIASASGGRITAYPADLTDNESVLLSAVCGLTDLDGYRNVVPERCRIVFSEAPFIELSAMENISIYKSEEFRQAFSEKVKLESVKESSLMYFYIYSFSDPTILSE